MMGSSGHRWRFDRGHWLQHPAVRTCSAMIGHGFGGWVKKNRCWEFDACSFPFQRSDIRGPVLFTPAAFLTTADIPRKNTTLCSDRGLGHFAMSSTRGLHDQNALGHRWDQPVAFHLRSPPAGTFRFPNRGRRSASRTVSCFSPSSLRIIAPTRTGCMSTQTRVQRR